MKFNKSLLLPISFVAVFFSTIAIFNIIYPKNQDVELPKEPIASIATPINKPVEFLHYGKVKSQLKQWNDTHPLITEYGVCGVTENGNEIPFLRMGTPGTFKILVHAHVNEGEHLATAATLKIMEYMLDEFDNGSDQTIFSNASFILKTHDIYFVPIYSPDTYLSNKSNIVATNKVNPRHMDMRHKIMSQFFIKQQFKAVLDISLGQQNICWVSSPNKTNSSHLIQKLAKEMATASDYSTLNIDNLPNSQLIKWYQSRQAISIRIELDKFKEQGEAKEIYKNDLISESQQLYKAFKAFVNQALYSRWDVIS